MPGNQYLYRDTTDHARSKRVENTRPFYYMWRVSRHSWRLRFMQEVIFLKAIKFVVLSIVLLLIILLAGYNPKKSSAQEIAPIV